MNASLVTSIPVIGTKGEFPAQDKKLPHYLHRKEQ